VAYLECVKGGGPGGLGTEVPQWQWGPGQGQSPGRGLGHFVPEAEAFLLMNA